MLALKAWRDLRAMGLRAVLIVLVIGAGPGTAAGVSLALHEVHATRDQFYSRYRLADLDLRLRGLRVPSGLVARARAAGASQAQTRLILPATALVSGGQPAAELVGMNPSAPLDQLALIAGRGLPRAPAAGGGVVLEASFADRYRIRVGRRLALRLEGRTIALAVVGLARSPEYLWATANPTYLVPQKGSLAVVWLPLDTLQRLAGVGHRVDDLTVDLPGGGSGIRAQALAVGLPVSQAIPRSEQYGLRLTNADIHSFSIFAPVMGAVFAIVGVLLIALSLHRLVASQRRELGALLAIGYPPRTVIATVLLPAGGLAAAGALIAIAVTIAVGRLIADQYASTVGFPTVAHPLAAGPLELAASLAIAATLLAALLPAWRLARLDPTDAMRGERIGSFALPRWLQHATAGGPTAITYALRGLLRRPLLTGATLLSIAGAIGLAAALNILVNSTNTSVDNQLANQGWNYTADLTTPLHTQQALALAARAGAHRVEPTVGGPATLTAPHDSSADVQLLGLPPRPQLLHLALTAGSAPRAGRIVLSAQTARTLAAHLGQRLKLTTSTRTATVIVGGIAQTLASLQSYLPATEADQVLSLPDHTTSLLLQATPATAARLRANPAIGRISSKTSTLQAEHDLISELTGLIAVLEAISLAVGALFLISTLALSYLDRRGEFATLQALGYGRRQIATAVTGEALTQTLLAAAISIPLGLLIATPLSQRIAQAWFAIGLHATPPNFLIVIAPALALALIAAIHATRRVLQINIATTVRARLIG
jgi:putative ABC transport system permease protein